MKFSAALQIYSVRDYAEKDLKGTLKKIKDMGYDGVEFAGLYGYEPSEIKDMLDEIGLIPVSAHVAIEEMLEDPQKTIGAYATIGCKYIAVPYLVEDRRPGSEGFAQTIKDVEEMAKVAKEYGIQMLYHNHDFEFVKVDGEYGLDLLYRSISEDLLKTEIDTCWVNVAGEDPADYIRKYTGRSPVVHLKDFVMDDRKMPANSTSLLVSKRKKAMKIRKVPLNSAPLAMGFRISHPY